jgi:hypothetical protein
VIHAVQAAIVFWLPGAVLFRVPWLDRNRRAALDAEERLFWAVILSVAVSLSAVLLLAAFHRYSFTRLIVADAALAATLAAASRLRLGLGPAARRPGLTAVVPLALVLLGVYYTLLAAAATGLAAAVAAGARSLAVRTRLLQWAPAALALGLIAAAVYAYYFRHAGGRLAEHDAAALRTFTNDYVTLPALVAALLGFALMARRSFWRDPALFTTVALFAAFVFFRTRIVPEQFWLTRRFVPAILPGVLLFAASAALSGPGGTRRAWHAVRMAIGVAFIALLAAQYARASRPVMQHQEYADLVPNVERLAALMGDGDLVIAESRNAGGDIHVLAAPLAYIYARNVLVLNSPRPDKAALAKFLEGARSRYSRVLFLGGSGSDMLSYRYGVRALTSDRFQVPEYDAPINAYPQGVRRKEFDFGLYEFTDAPRTGAPWFDLDVGRNDDLHVLRFHAKEATEGRSFRWTHAISYVAVTTVGPGAREVMLEMADGGRPPAAPRPDVSVYLHGQLLGTVQVTHAFNRYSFPLPAELAERASAFRDPVELKLLTTLWNPRATLGTPDNRDLGVMLDRVTVR